MKKANQGAIRPQFYPSFTTPGEARQPVTPESLSENEKALATIAHTSGWKVLKDYALDLVEELEDANRQAIARGLDFTEIGKNAVVLSLSKDIIHKLITKVNDALEASEANERK